MPSKASKKGTHGMSVTTNIEANKYPTKYKKYARIKTLDVNHHRRVHRSMHPIYGLTRHNKMLGGLPLRRIWRRLLW